MLRIRSNPAIDFDQNQRRKIILSSASSCHCASRRAPRAFREIRSLQRCHFRFRRRMESEKKEFWYFSDVKVLDQDFKLLVPFLAKVISVLLFVFLPIRRSPSPCNFVQSFRTKSRFHPFAVGYPCSSLQNYYLSKRFIVLQFYIFSV